MSFPQPGFYAPATLIIRKIASNPANTRPGLALKLHQKFEYKLYRLNSLPRKDRSETWQMSDRTYCRIDRANLFRILRNIAVSVVFSTGLIVSVRAQLPAGTTEITAQ